MEPFFSVARGICLFQFIFVDSIYGLKNLEIPIISMSQLATSQVSQHETRAFEVQRGLQRWGCRSQGENDVFFGCLLATHPVNKQKLYQPWSSAKQFEDKTNQNVHWICVPLNMGIWWESWCLNKSNERFSRWNMLHNLHIEKNKQTNKQTNKHSWRKQ